MSLEDLHDVLEVVSVDNRNRRAIQRAYELQRTKDSYR